MARRKSNLRLNRNRKKAPHPHFVNLEVGTSDTDIQLLSTIKSPLRTKIQKRKFSPFKPSPLTEPFRSPLFKSSPAVKKQKSTSSRSLFETKISNNLNDDSCFQELPTVIWNEEPKSTVDNSPDSITVKPIELEPDNNNNLYDDTFSQELPTFNLNEEPKLATNDSPDSITKKLIELVPDVVRKLSESNGLDKLMLSFFQQLQSGTFPVDNIAFLLWTDVVRWFDCKNTTRMRYSTQSKMFWKLGWRLFGGRFINFMGGYKNDAEIVQGVTERGKFDPLTSNINFAVPDAKTLRSFDPYNVDGERRPGIYTDIMEKISENMDHQSTCLTFDGKKLKQGLKESSGDVDLLGFEIGSTLQDRLNTLQSNMDEVDLFLNELNSENENLCARKLPEVKKENTRHILFHSLKSITDCVESVKQVKVKKQYCKQKLIDRSGESNWRKGKYVYAISAIIAFLHDIDNFLLKARKTIDNICYCISYLNDATYISGSTVNIFNTSVYFPLPEVSSNSNSRLIKQRSNEWFDLRKKAKVTGSTLHKAVGFEGIQKQKEHFEHVICGIPEKEHSEEVLGFMKHGTENEINAVATLVAKVIPVLYPSLIFSEEGCVEVQNPEQDTFLVVSPDGSLRENQQLESTVVAVEIKCPVRGVHTMFPTRYLLQCLSEIEVLNVESLLYVSWTVDDTMVFRVKRDSLLFSKALKLCLSLYYGENIKRVTKLSDEAKELKAEIVKKCKEVERIGLFPSAIVDERSTHIENKPVNYNIDQIKETMLSVKEVKQEHYELTREKASEAVVFLCSDLDRSWKKEKVKCAPVAWFPKGYSLQTETMRKIAEKVHTQCHDTGIHMPCQSFDGQWHNIVVRTVKGQPLTKLQLQKDVWKEVEQMRKPLIMSELKTMNKEPAWRFVWNGTTKVIEATNNGVKLPKLNLNERNLPKEKVDDNQIESIGENPTLIDVIPQSIIMSEEVEENVLSTTQVKDLVEMNAMSSNINEDEWLRQLSLEIDEDYTQHSIENNENDESTTADQLTNPLNENPCSSHSASSTLILTESDAKHILAMLQTDDSCNKKSQWTHVTANDILDKISSVDKLQKLRDVELRVLVRYIKRIKDIKLKESASKQGKIQQLATILNMERNVTNNIGAVPTRKKSIKSLSDLAASVLSKRVSKAVLNAVYAEYVWPSRYRHWIESSPLVNNPTIENLDEPEEWFYMPEYSLSRQQLEVRCIDSTHLLTRTRRKSCRGGLDALSNVAWADVAKSGKTFLTPIMVEEITDPMSVSMAVTHFSEAVEDQMRHNGERDSADLCKDIRNWWEAEDCPGIHAADRILLRTGLRNRLLKKVNFERFPPPTMSISGWPLQLWEALIANIDAKSLLYSLCHGGTYNVRAFSSLIGETFFSELTLNDKRGQGTVTTEEFGQFIGATIEQVQMRLDPERQFFYRTAKSHVYNLVEDTEQMIDDCPAMCNICQSTPSVIDKTIHIRDHPFDKPERRRLSGRKKEATVSTSRNAVQKGSLGVRWNSARRNDSKMLLTKKMGL